MKRKNVLYLLAIMMVAILSVGFTSCGSDDDEIGDALIDQLQGTWEFSKGTEKVMGITITMDRASLQEIKRSMESSLGSSVKIWDETLTFEGNKVNGISYTLVDRELLLAGIDVMDDITISVKSVNSSTLVLREVIKMNGVDLTADMEYKKK